MDMDIVYLILTLGVPFFVWAREWNITERAHARESLYIKFPHHLLKFYRSHYIKIVITIISTQSTWCIKLRQHNKEAYQHCTWHEKKKEIFARNQLSHASIYKVVIVLVAQHVTSMMGIFKQGENGSWQANDDKLFYNTNNTLTNSVFILMSVIYSI